jgi:O-antigen ligase
MTAIAVLLAVGSQSRGAWFAMLLATIYLGFKYRTWRLLIPAAFFVISVGVVYLHPTHGGMKWSVASSGRVYVWRKTMEIIAPSTVFYGYGPGAFTMEFPNDDAKGKIAQGWTPETVVDRPHNFYLQVLHASGGLSLIALLVLFAGFLLESKEVAINAAVLSYLVNVFFTDSCTSVAPLFWILLGTGVGRLKSLNKEKK